MALPTLEDKITSVKDKIEKENIISEIAKSVFKSAKITTEAAAKFAVAPSVPQMVDDVLDDLKSGSIDKFNKAMDKLDKLVRVLGIDLKKYNKELANFAEKREQKIIKSEEKIQTLRENNIVADITKAGDIKVLSQKEIENKQDDLRDTEKRIKDLEKKIAKDTKQVQDHTGGNGTDNLILLSTPNQKEKVVIEVDRKEHFNSTTPTRISDRIFDISTKLFSRLSNIKENYSTINIQQNELNDNSIELKIKSIIIYILLTLIVFYFLILKTNLYIKLIGFLIFKKIK